MAQAQQRRMYSNADNLNLLLVYGECNKNLTRTIQVFSERFPNLPTPGRRTIRTLLKNCLTYGSFKPKIVKNHPVTDDADLEVTVLAYFHANPKASLRDARRDLGLSFTAIQRILKKHKWKPFKYHLLHNLKENDLFIRREFCEFLLLQTQENYNF